MALVSLAQAWRLGAVALLLVAAPPPLAGQESPTPGAGPDVEVIKTIRERSNRAIADHDTAGIAASFAPQVVVFASTSEMTIGRDENARSFAQVFATRPDVVYRRTPTDVRVDPQWRMAAEEGRWTGRWTDRGGPVRISGSYFAKWRQYDGKWLIESETYVPERCVGGDYCKEPPRRPPPPAVRPDDVATLDGIIAAYYDVVSGPAGSLPDPARDQTLHHPKAWITMLDRAADETTAAAMISLAEYYQRTGVGPRREGFFEREIHRVTQRIGSLVHVWSTYQSTQTPGGPVFSRGINSIQLYWDGKRWWILGWTFDDERHGNPIPGEYLPR